MLRNKYKGIFITLEGLDGSGLTTQSSKVADFFRNNGMRAYLTKEPTDNVIGGLIRGALSGVYKLPHTALQLLFSADRGHHLNREIVPILEKNRMVVCDRYFFSTIAFGSLNIDRKWLLEMNRHIMLPDLTILLKVSPKICVERIRANRFDFELFEKVEELTKVWRTYEWLTKKFKNTVVINGEGGIEDVNDKIIETILNTPKGKKYKRIIKTNYGSYTRPKRK